MQVRGPFRTSAQGLRGRTLVVTRPVGSAAALARRIRRCGGVPLLLPGLALRRVADQDTACSGLLAALSDELLIFSSPAAVRFAAALTPLRTLATVLAVGQGTAQALRRSGVAAVWTPSRQDSEGLLTHPLLQSPGGHRISVIGAPGGRGLLRAQLEQHGAQVREVHVYRREPSRLDRRHVEKVIALPASAVLLLSSREALQNLLQLLPAAALQRLRSSTVVVSSERLAVAVAEAGFSRRLLATSALSADLLDAAMRVK